MTLAEGSSAAKKTDVENESPWLDDTASRPTVGLPKFLAIPNHVIRAPWSTSALAIVCGAYLYRGRYETKLDVRTIRRWTSLSRSSSYRLLGKFNGLLDTLGYEQMFGAGPDPMKAGYVKVLVEDLHAVGPARAIFVALLRRWPERKDVKSTRNGAFEVNAKLFASAVGLDERTVRRILDELSTGKHRNIKPENELKYQGRFELLQKRGHVNYLRLLSKSEQTDRWNRLTREAEARRVRECAADRPKNEPQRKAAVDKRTQSLDDDDPGALALKAFEEHRKVSAALTAVISFLKACKR